MSAPRLLASGHASLAARIVLGAVFLYLGVTKALNPVGFLKLVRQFDLLPPLALNLVAAVVPWCEIVFGALLLAGRLTRGTALVSLLLLVGFTAAIILRAVALHRTGTAAFCNLRCGCGTGEVLVCLKLLENAGLCLLAALILVAPEHPFPFRRRPAPL